LQFNNSLTFALRILYYFTFIAGVEIVCKHTSYISRGAPGTGKNNENSLQVAVKKI
jgi:hypothetical protein